MTQDTGETAARGDAGSRPREIASLNLDDLDVAELERRLELAAGDMGAAAWLCGEDYACNCNMVNSPPGCETDMPVCDVNGSGCDINMPASVA